MQMNRKRRSSDCDVSGEIARSALPKALLATIGGPAHDSVLTGKAGSGKTGCIVGLHVVIVCIGILCDEMTATQQLSVPLETLDSIPGEYLAQMASERVLTFSER